MDTKRYEGRSMPGPVTLAACLLELADDLYSHVVRLTPEGPEKEAVILEWTRFRDEWKPRIDRIIANPRR